MFGRTITLKDMSYALVKLWTNFGSITFLSLLCIFFSVIFGTSIIETSGYSQVIGPGLSNLKPDRELSKDKYSIIYLSSFRRIPILSKILNSLLKQESKHCEKIYIYWNDFKHSIPAPNLTAYNISNSTVPIEIIDTEMRELVARFLIPQNLETQTICNIDDDIFVNFTALDTAFEEFKRRGFPLSVFGNYATLWRKGKYSWKRGRDFNIVLTGLSFINVDLFEIYHSYKYKSVRDYSAEKNNCEDFIMNYVAYDAFGNRPIYYNIKHHLQNTIGLSRRPSNSKARVECLKFLDKSFDFVEITRNTSVPIQK